VPYQTHMSFLFSSFRAVTGVLAINPRLTPGDIHIRLFQSRVKVRFSTSGTATK